MNIRKILAATALVVALPALSGCASYDNMSPAEQRRLTGQVLGGVTGAALGSLVGGGTGRSIAIGAGAIVGGIVGGEVAQRN
jgi:uncharacterized protein YcfJ